MPESESMMPASLQGSRDPVAAWSVTVANSAAIRLIVTAARGGDLSRALGIANARVRYRFTGLYRVEGQTLYNICLFDRENPTLRTCGEVCALADTYCSLVDANARSFTTVDARQDERLTHHSSRCTVVSYAGVPVVLKPDVRGTLCHFDSRPRLLPRGEFAFMERVGPALADFLVMRALYLDDALAPNVRTSLE